MNKTLKLASLFIITIFSLIAADAVSDIKPLIIDIANFEAEPASGRAIDMMGMSMITLNRTYENGKKEFTVTVIIAGKQMAPQADFREGTEKTKEGDVKYSTINGFKVSQVHLHEDNSGQVTVFVGTSETKTATLALSYEGLTKEEALKLIKNYNWNKISAASKKYLN